MLDFRPSMDSQTIRRRRFVNGKFIQEGNPDYREETPRSEAVARIGAMQGNGSSSAPVKGDTVDSLRDRTLEG